MAVCFLLQLASPPKLHLFSLSSGSRLLIIGLMVIHCAFKPQTGTVSVTMLAHNRASCVHSLQPTSNKMPISLQGSRPHHGPPSSDGWMVVMVVSLDTGESANLEDVAIRICSNWHDHMMSKAFRKSSFWQDKTFSCQIIGNLLYHVLI